MREKTENMQLYSSSPSCSQLLTDKFIHESKKHLTLENQMLLPCRISKDMLQERKLLEALLYIER